MLPTVQAFQEIELFENVVDQLDVEQIVHANNSPLNVVDLKASVDREGDLSSCQHREILRFLDLFGSPNGPSDP